jgi:SmpB protein
MRRRSTWRCHRESHCTAGAARSASVGSQVGLSGQNHRVKKPEADPVVARNRKAAHDYHLGESWEAGIVLQGAEVKALRAGRASLVGGFAAVEDREIWLHGVHIPQYSQARWFNDGSRRKRKLLLHRAQTTQPSSSSISLATQPAGFSPSSNFPPGSSHSSRSFFNKGTRPLQMITVLREIGS